MTQSNDKKDLLSGSIPRHLWRLTLPMAWGVGVIISFQLIDMYFIGQISSDALAAVSFTFPITYALLTVSIGFGVAMSSNVSRLVGENEIEKVCRVVTQGIALSFLCVSAVVFVLWLGYESLFKMMGVNDALIGYIHDYIPLICLSVPLVAIPMVANSAMRAEGDAVTPALIMTVAAFANCVLDPILIFGYLGAPEMGVEGAALATVIANMLALFSGLYIITERKKRFKVKCLMACHEFKDTLRRMLTIALPVSVASLILPLTNSIIIALLSGISVEAVAAFGIASRVEAFAFIILMALSTSMAPIIGQNLGAKQFDRVREVLKVAISYNIIWSLFVALVLAVAGGMIAGAFTDDAQIIRVAQLFFWIVPVSYALSNLLNGWMSAFNAMGKPKQSFIMMIGKYILLLIPAIYIGNMWGAVGISVAMAIVNVVSGVVVHIYSWRACPK